METTINEMLVAAGIVTEESVNELNNTLEEQFNVLKSYELSDEEIQAQTQHLKTYVGQFVKVGNKYGMIDEVIQNRFLCALGFVYSTPTMRGGQMVHEDDISPIDENELPKAIESAIGYYWNEATDLTNRLAMHYEIDIPHIKRIQEMIQECSKWLTELKKLQDGEQDLFVIDETDRVDEQCLAYLNQALAEG